MTVVADFELGERLAPDRGEVYRAPAPARLASCGDRLLVHVMRPLDGSAFARLRPLLEDLASVRSDHLASLVEIGFRHDADPPFAWYATTDHGPSDLTTSRSPVDVLLAVAGAARGVHALHEVGLVHGGIGAEAVRPQPGGGIIDLPEIGPDRLADGRICTVDDPVRLDPLDPGVARGVPPSRASDLWSLGATLHRAVTGRGVHPGLAGDPAIIAVQRVMFEPVELGGDLDPGIAAVIASCLARDPAERPPSAAALADHLETLARAR